jgi:hypothetical protein
MNKDIENVALFDMDGTLCDFDAALFRDLEKMRAPSESQFHPPIRDETPNHIKNRAWSITSSENWWANLPKFKLGWDVYGVARTIGYRTVILTQGPKKNPSAWSGKKKWIDHNMGEDTDIILTRDKGLVYGRVLVDDYPPYLERWLAWRPRGLAIMPANQSNAGYHHKQVIRYDGSNLDEVVSAMKKAFR